MVGQIPVDRELGLLADLFRDGGVVVVVLPAARGAEKGNSSLTHSKSWAQREH